MESLAALSLACNVLELIERGYKSVRIIREISQSKQGLRQKHDTLLSESETLHVISKDLKTAHRRLDGPRLEQRMQGVAVQCLAIHAAIQTVLDKCKPKQTQSLISAAGTSVRLLRAQADIEHLQLLLDSGQKMLSFLVTASTRNDVLELGTELRQAAQTFKEHMRLSGQQCTLMLSKLATLSDDLDQLRNSGPVFSQLQQAINSLVQTDEALHVSKILDRLHFPTMHDRFQNVSESAPHTFNWIFGHSSASNSSDDSDSFSSSDDLGSLSNWKDIDGLDDSSASNNLSAVNHPHDLDSLNTHDMQRTNDGPKERFSSLCSFPEWLCGGSGIFHIQGKPGSGKSTLMKYLCEHRETLNLLRLWADGDDLIFSKFFFWKFGTAEEKSLAGLTQGLLSAILEQRPQFAKQLFPDEYSRTNPTNIGPSEAVTISNRMIADAFDRLTASPDMLQGHRLCLFIDGLDEFDESPNHSYYTLTQKLISWASSTHGRIKICVSSRQIYPFVEVFSKAQSLTLQDLTKNDIQQLVRERLVQNKYFQRLYKQDKLTCDGLVSDILSKAQGVFLWVCVLLVQLEDALVSGDSFAILKQLVTKAPTELKSFFGYILENIPQRYTWHAYILLALSMRRQGFLLLHNNQTEETLWPNHGSRSAGMTLISCSYLLEALDMFPLEDVLRRDTPGSCADVESFRNREKEASRRIVSHCRGLLEVVSSASSDDIHRISFTHRSIPEALYEILTPLILKHGLNDDLISATLAWAFIVDFGSSRILPLHERTQKSHYNVTFNLHELVVSIRHQRVLNNPRPVMLLLHKIEQLLLRYYHGVTSWDQVSPPVHIDYPNKYSMTGSANLIYTVCAVGLHEYLRFYFQNARNSVIKSLPRLLALCAVAIYHHRLALSLGGTLYSRTLEVLFEQGLSPASTMDFDEHYLRRKSITTTDPRPSLWSYILLNIISRAVFRTTLFASPWLHIETWLRHGADPNVVFTLVDSDLCELDLKELPRSDLRAIRDHDVRLAVKNERGDMDGHTEMRWLSLSGKDAVRFILDMRQTAGGTSTLADLVRFRKPSNMDILLQLIEDSQAKRRAAVPNPNHHPGSSSSSSEALKTKALPPSGAEHPERTPSHSPARTSKAAADLATWAPLIVKLTSSHLFVCYDLGPGADMNFATASLFVLLLACVVAGITSLRGRVEGHTV